MASLTIDFCYEGDLATKLHEYAGQFGLTYDVLTLHGPAGGWPEVRLSGPDESVRAAALDFYGPAGQGESEQFALSQITP